jgi:hypothetical protein
MNHLDENSASKTFDHIRAGSQNLLLTLRGKLVDIQGHLEKGEFQAAQQHARRFGELLEPLAMAEQVLGFMGQGRIISAENIETGMVLLNIGRITGIDVRPWEGGLEERVAELVDGRYVLLRDGYEFVVAKDEQST